MEKNLVEDSIKRRSAELLGQIREIARKSGTDPKELQIMAVTKRREESEILSAFAGGFTLFGENRPQEYRDKKELFDRLSVEVHLIGQLQKNKVKYVVGNVAVIESVDSILLAEEISRRAEMLEVVQDVLIEVNAGREPQKSGVIPEQLDEVLDCMASMKGIHVRGLMTVAPKPQAEAEAAFECMHKLFVDRKEKKIDNVNMDLLSMGMSADFALALRHGANLVRIGSAIFADETRRL